MSLSFDCSAHCVVGQLCRVTTYCGVSGMPAPGEYVTRTIDPEHTTSRSVPTRIVSMTPSACCFTPVTGFRGFHCAKALEDKQNRSSITPARIALRRPGITAARFEVAWPFFAVGVSARPLASKYRPVPFSPANRPSRTCGLGDQLYRPPFQFLPQL